MKRFLLTALTLLAAATLSAQDFDSAIKRWNDGPLTWDDFTPYSGGYPVISSLDFNWHAQKSTFKKGNLRVLRLQTECYMNPIASWVNPDYKNPQTLRYQQTAFDYAELCCRQLQRELDNNANAHPARELNQFYSAKADRFIAKLREETDQGRDSSMVNFFAAQIAEEFAALPDSEEIPDVQTKNWGLGLHYGYGNQFFLGDAANYLRPLHGLHWGFDISYKNLYIYWHMLIAGGGKTRNPFYHDGYLWAAGQNQTGGAMEFDLAYPVVNTPWVKVSPFAGAGFGFSSVVVGKDAYNKNVTNGIGGLRFVGGLCFDVKVLREIDLTNAPIYYYGIQTGTSRRYTENSIRLIAYLARTNHDTSILDETGNRFVPYSLSLNFGIVYNLHYWNLR